jgi:ParB-like chromosome segregation protein Spo0J
MSLGRECMSDWSADEIVIKNVSDLTPYAQNSRIHTAEQVAQIAQSIETFGFTIPILIDESGVIIAGHGRVMALDRLGKDQAPCIVAKGWSEGKRAAYVIADNKHTLNGKWDYEKLGEQFKFLENLDFDITLTGFSLDEVEDVLSEWDTDHEFIDKINAADEPLTSKLIVTGSDDELDMFEEWLQGQLADLGYESIEVQRK